MSTFKRIELRRRALAGWKTRRKNEKDYQAWCEENRRMNEAAREKVLRVLGRNSS